MMVIIIDYEEGENEFDIDDLIIDYFDFGWDTQACHLDSQPGNFKKKQKQKTTQLSRPTFWSLAEIIRLKKRCM